MPPARTSGLAFLLLLAAAVCAASETALAQDRPSEADLFGAEPSAGGAADAGASNPVRAEHSPQSSAPPTRDVTPATPASTEPGPVPDTRDQSILGGGEATPMFSDEPAPADPLTIGGQLYLRAQTRALEQQRVAAFSFNTPTLLDVFFDARPNDRPDDL
jgi:hypothetical protein